MRGREDCSLLLMRGLACVRTPVGVRSLLLLLLLLVVRVRHGEVDAERRRDTFPIELLVGRRPVVQLLALRSPE